MRIKQPTFVHLNSTIRNTDIEVSGDTRVSGDI